MRSTYAGHTSQAPTPPLPWADGLRAVAMMVVLLWHALLTVVTADGAAPGSWISPLGGLAHGAVLTFIVLSGYLLGRHWRRGELGNETKRFLLRRVWRLLPTYWFVVTLTILAMLVLGLRHPGGTHWDVGLPMTWGNTVLNYLLLTDLAGTSPYNHPLWTIPVELHLYLLAPLLVFVRRRTPALAVGAVLTVAVALAAPDFVAPFFCFAFVLAFWTGLHRRTLRAIGPRQTLAVVLPGALVGWAVAVVIVLADDLGGSGVRFLVLDTVTTPVLVAWLLVGDLSDRTGWSHRMLSTGPLRWLGSRSYSTYLVHALVIEIVWRFAVEPLGLTGHLALLGMLTPLSVALSLVVGALVFHGVERPSTRRAAAVGARPQPVAIASKDPT